MKYLIALVLMPLCVFARQQHYSEQLEILDIRPIPMHAALIRDAETGRRAVYLLEDKYLNDDAYEIVDYQTEVSYMDATRYFYDYHFSYDFYPINKQSDFQNDSEKCDCNE